MELARRHRSTPSVLPIYLELTTTSQVTKPSLHTYAPLERMAASLPARVVAAVHAWSLSGTPHVGPVHPTLHCLSQPREGSPAAAGEKAERTPGESSPDAQRRMLQSAPPKPAGQLHGEPVP